MSVLGYHVLLELRGCNPNLLNDLNHIRQVMLTAANDAGATVIGDSFHHFSPQGVSGVLVIAESHISIHTWPEHAYAAADIFSCGSSFLPREAARRLADQLGSEDPQIKEFERGLIAQPGSDDDSYDTKLTGNWLVEAITPDLVAMSRLRSPLFSGATAYQKAEILDSRIFGRSLLLDGKMQSTELDEFVYHESLVHPAMLSHPEPRTVFIGGGGDGGTLREALAHRSVENVTMIDLDSEVVELCRAYLPNHHQGSFDDPRLTLLHQDAREYLQAAGDSFDVMILDLVDPLEEGTAYLLYTDEFYRIAKQRLNPGGVLVTQSSLAGLPYHKECFTAINHTLNGVFAHTAAAQFHLPAFHTLSGFTIASDSPLPQLTDAELELAIAHRISKKLRHYDAETHRGMFALPKYLRDGIAEETRINRDDSPIHMV